MCGWLGGQVLTQIDGEVGVVVRLPVGDEVDLVLPPLLLEALLGAPVLTHAAARQDDDHSPHQPEPCRRTTHTLTRAAQTHPAQHFTADRPSERGSTSDGDLILLPVRCSASTNTGTMCQGSTRTQA